MSPEALALAALVERQEIGLYRRAGLLPLAVVPLQRSELRVGVVDDLQQHRACVLLACGASTRPARARATTRDSAAPRRCSGRPTARRTGRAAGDRARSRPGRRTGPCQSSTSSSGRLPSRRMASTISAGDQARPASGARRFSAHRSSSHRQPSAVDSRRISSRAGSSGSSGPARRSGSGRMPGSRSGSGGPGRSRRPRSATSSRRRRASSSGTAVIRSDSISTWSQSARSSRQEWPTAWRTRSSSKGLHGWRSAVQAARRCSNSSGSSPGKISVRAVRPCLTALRHERDFPFGVRGPHDRRAFRRLASTCRDVVIALADLRTDLGVLHRILLPGSPSRHTADRAVPCALTALLYRTIARRSRPACGIFSGIQEFRRSPDFLALASPIIGRTEVLRSRARYVGDLSGFGRSFPVREGTGRPGKAAAEGARCKWGMRKAKSRSRWLMWPR